MKDMIPSVRFLSPTVVNYATKRWAWYTASRPHFNLWVCLLGVGTLRVNGLSHAISPGFAVLLHPDDVVEGQKSDESRFCNIGLHFNPLMTEATDFDFVDYCQRPIVLRHLPIVREMAHYMDRLIDAGRERHLEELNQLCSQILRVFIRDFEEGEVDPLNQLVRKQAEGMRNHPEQVWTVEQMASQTQLSTSQFTRRFNELFKMPPNAFLIQQRLRRAQELLMESRLSINEIAEALGYRDVAFLSRQFKAHVGYSPATFRKRAWELSGRFR